MIKSENIIRNICENYEDAEKLLLEAMESDDTDVAYGAKLALIAIPEEFSEINHDNIMNVFVN